MAVSTITNDSIDAAAAIATSKLGAGAVLQVVNVVYNASTSSNTTTYTDTGLAATITPKFSTSKIFVIVSANGVYKDTNNTWAQLRTTLNGSVDAYMGSFMAYNNSTNANSIGTVAIHYLSSPATTSACTYKLQLSSANGANVYINCSAQDTSSITLMEIAQ
jgi:hypothetical protein